MDTEFAFYEVELACPEQRPDPTRNCAQYVPLLQRVILAARQDSRLRAGLRYHVCGTGRPTSLSRTQEQVVKNVQAILRECPQYRRAFCATI